MTGVVRRRLDDEPAYLEFHYRIVRAWQKPVESVLAGGLGMLPLAPLSDVSREALPDVIRRMEERLKSETTPEEAATLWTATYVLMGLRYPQGFTDKLLEGVRAMEESVTYQAIVAKGRAKGIVEGRAEEARRLLLRLGRKRLGPPPPAARATIEAMDDLTRLEGLTDRLLDVATWDELLAGPTPRRRNGTRKKPT
jgi:hypothetical protein